MLAVAEAVVPVVIKMRTLARLTHVSAWLHRASCEARLHCACSPRALLSFVKFAVKIILSEHISSRDRDPHIHQWCRRSSGGCSSSSGGPEAVSQSSRGREDCASA